MSTFDSLQQLLAETDVPQPVRTDLVEVARFPGSWVVQLAEHSQLGSNADVDDVVHVVEGVIGLRDRAEREAREAGEDRVTADRVDRAAGVVRKAVSV